MIRASILGCEGSIGFPKQNIHPVLGRPLVAYSMLAARATKSIDLRKLGLWKSAEA